MDAQSAGRRRLVAGAADMISRRGLNATSVRELAKHARAPLGSTYHYFPGGKTDLATAAVRWADDVTAQVLTTELAAGPRDGVAAFLAMWRRTVLANDFQAGCPVLAVAVEDLTEQDRAPGDAAAAAFTGWARLLETSLREAGATAAAAPQVAMLGVAAVEGTVAICRVQRDITPLDLVAAQLDDVIDAALCSRA